jgi:hypothetical protein
VERAAWQLVWLSRELADNAMAAFTGRLLALVGPLDEHCIAFNRLPGAAQQTALGAKKVPDTSLYLSFDSHLVLHAQYRQGDKQSTASNWGALSNIALASNAVQYVFDVKVSWNGLWQCRRLLQRSGIQKLTEDEGR